MHEIDRLKSIKITECPEYIKNILDGTHNKNPNLWNVFCLVCNRYTIHDKKDYSKQIRSFINDFIKTDVPNLGYIEHVLKCKNPGVSFGRISSNSDYLDNDDYWEVGIDDYSDGTYQGNGLLIFKHFIVKNSRTFINTPGYFYISKVEIKTI